MVSRTKTLLDDETIREIFGKHNIEDIQEIKPLGAGEFNAVYLVRTDKDYVLKVAPDNEKVMTHEQNMIEAEVYWYHIMQEKTTIPCPKIYFEDFSKKIIPQNYFVMEKIEGNQKDELHISKEESRKLNEQIAKMMAELHKVKNDKFGYIQNELYDNWFVAFQHMIANLISDCHKMGEQTIQGDKLLALTEVYRDALMTAKCHLVNADAWDANFIAVSEKEGYRLYWIDPERSLWGDKMLDLLCVEFENNIKEKETLKTYNNCAEEPILPTREEEIRYGFALGWLALVMEVEKYYRYSPEHEGWYRNIESTKAMYDRCFKILDKYL